MDATDRLASSPPGSPLTVMSTSPSPPASPEVRPAPPASRLDASNRYPSPSSSGGASPAKQPSDEVAGDAPERKQHQPLQSYRDDGREQPRPVKRRKIGGASHCSWEPTEGPQYLDLRRCAQESRRLQDEINMARLVDTLRRKSKIVVIAGAGISVSAGSEWRNSM